LKAEIHKQTGPSMAIITISRGSFAGGKAVAELLSQRLGYPALSREEVLARAAGDYGIVEGELKAALNESPPFWQQVPGKRLAYVKCVAAVLLEHASRGNLIYHGHVGHLLLGGLPHVLRVRVIADLEYRIQSAMRQAGVQRDAAMAHIRRVDEERSRWARLLYGVDWEDPVQYTVILNLGQVSVPSACETIVRMSELEEFKLTPAGWERFEDLRLGCRVWAALAKHPETRSAGIEVTAHRGDVVISGTVGSARAVELIPRIAEGVEGVTTVECKAGMGTDWYW
jgi:cytidylate kinase